MVVYRLLSQSDKSDYTPKGVSVIWTSPASLILLVITGLWKSTSRTIVSGILNDRSNHSTLPLPCQPPPNSALRISRFRMIRHTPDTSDVPCRNADQTNQWLSTRMLRCEKFRNNFLIAQKIHLIEDHSKIIDFLLNGRRHQSFQLSSPNSKLFAHIPVAKHFECLFWRIGVVFKWNTRQRKKKREKKQKHKNRRFFENHCGID